MRVKSTSPLMEQERLHRARARQDDSPAFALDFDVIFPFLQLTSGEAPARGEHETVARNFVSALLAQKRFRLRILPGTLHEITRYSARLLGASVQWSQALEDLSSVDQPLLARDSSLMRKLTSWTSSYAPVLKNLELLDMILRRADRDSSSDARELRWPLSDNSVNEALHLLTAYRPASSRELANFVDAVNLALVTDAAELGMDFGLVTQMSVATQVVEELWAARHKNDEPPPLMVLAPRLAMLRLGLAGASDQQIQDALDKCREIESLVSSYIHGDESRSVGMYRAWIEISYAERHLTQLLQGLSDLPARLSVTWVRPSDVLPEDVDLDLLITSARAAAIEIQKQVMRVLSEARKLFESAVNTIETGVNIPAVRDALSPLLRAATGVSSASAWEAGVIGADSNLDSESKERLLVGQVIWTVALANQLCREFAVSDHGIDMEIEFKNDAGQATGKKLYLQLKSGDSYLEQRKKDDSEVFRIKNPRHAEYWRKQAFPVFIVLRTSDGIVRWMEIRGYLRKEASNGRPTTTRIKFDGEAFTVASLLRWRDEALRESSGSEV